MFTPIFDLESPFIPVQVQPSRTQRRHSWSLNRPQETEYLLVSLTLEINAPKKLQILRKQGRSNLKTCLLLSPLDTTYRLLLLTKQDIFLN